MSILDRTLLYVWLSLGGHVTHSTMYTTQFGKIQFRSIVSLKKDCSVLDLNSYPVLRSRNGLGSCLNHIVNCASLLSSSYMRNKRRYI